MNIQTKFYIREWVWYMYSGMPWRSVVHRIDIGIHKGANETDGHITIDYTVNPPNAELSLQTQRCESKVYHTKEECLADNVGAKRIKRQPPKKVKA